MKHQEPCYFLLHKQFGCIKYLHFPAAFWPLYKTRGQKVFLFNEHSPGSKGEAEGESGLVLTSGGWFLVAGISSKHNEMG